MPSELPPDLNIRPPEFDPAENKRLIEVIRDPAMTPVHRHKIDVEDRFEEFTSASVLAGGYQWFVLGLAYCMIKIDRSLIEAYRDALGKSVKILTHRAQQPLIEVQGSEAWRTNPWSGTIQGIPDEHAMQFIDYAASFLFRRQDTGHEWNCGFKEVRIIDPFFQTPRPVSCWVALPRNVTVGRRMVVSSSELVGLPPLISIVKESRDG